MVYIMFTFLFGVVLGLIGVASNPSPYFAAFWLVLSAGMSCGVLIGHGGSFLSLVLFIIYLGGMLVVFAYSAALAAEDYPESWDSWPVLLDMCKYGAGVVAVALFLSSGWGEGTWMSVNECQVFPASGADTSGVAVVYSMGGGLLVMAAWVLLVTLFVVLELTRGKSRGALRAV